MRGPVKGQTDRQADRGTYLYEGVVSPDTRDRQRLTDRMAIVQTEGVLYREVEGQ